MIDNAYSKLSAWKGKLSEQWIETATNLNYVALEQRFESSDTSLLNGEIYLEFRIGVICLKFSIGEKIIYITEGKAQILDFKEAYNLIIRIMDEIVKMEYDACD